jgi:hypothetical protein
VKGITIRRLRWAGHIIRIEGERIQKMILKGKCHNIRQVGKKKNKMGGRRPEGHITDPRIRGCRRRAEDREEWRHFLREVRAQKGLWRHRWMDGQLRLLNFVRK